MSALCRAEWCKRTDLHVVHERTQSVRTRKSWRRRSRRVTLRPGDVVVSPERPDVRRRVVEVLEDSVRLVGDNNRHSVVSLETISSYRVVNARREMTHVVTAKQYRERTVAERGYAPKRVVFTESGSVLQMHWDCPMHRYECCAVCRGRGELVATYDEMFTILMREKLL